MIFLAGPAVKEPPIAILAVVNPVDGRAWNARGVEIACPIPESELKLAFHRVMRTGESGSHLRVIVVRTKPTSAEPVTMSLSGLPEIGLLQHEKNVRTYGVRLASADRPLPLHVVYSADASRKIVEFRYQSGRLKILKGADRHPMVVHLPRGYDFTAERRIRKTDPRYPSFPPAFVVSLDYKPGDYSPGIAYSGVLRDSNGKMVGTRGGGGLHKRYQTFTFERPTTSSCRFVYSHRSRASQQFVVPMRPSRKTTRSRN